MEGWLEAASPNATRHLPGRIARRNRNDVDGRRRTKAVKKNLENGKSTWRLSGGMMFQLIGTKATMPRKP